jgi:hypothetical protein
MIPKGCGFSKQLMRQANSWRELQRKKTGFALCSRHALQSICSI